MKKEERGPLSRATLDPPPKESVLAIEPPKPTTVDEVEEHNRIVRQPSADRACYRKACARCDAKEEFAAHELRRRGLRLIVDHSVLCMTVWLARWRCRQCRYVFTDYPDFRTSV
jgi:hypothetical protein